MRDLGTSSSILRPRRKLDMVAPEMPPIEKKIVAPSQKAECPIAPQISGILAGHNLVTGQDGEGYITGLLKQGD